MTKKPIAIVLGGTFPHRRLLANLRERGFRTVLVDFHDNPCAKECADEHVKESTLNRDGVLALAKQSKAELVISACIDQANLVACSVAEELGLPHPYDRDTALAVTNKRLMKEFMLRAGIPTSPFVSVSRDTNIVDHRLQYPLIVKPVDSNSSKGVRRVENERDLLLHTRNAIEASRSGQAIIEEFVAGVEVGVDCFVHEDTVSMLMTKQRRKIPLDSEGEQQIFGCTWPAVLPEDVNDTLANIAGQIASSLGLKNCPLMFQAMVREHSMSVIEFAARFGGGESYKVIELSTGVDIIDLSIKSFLGQKADVLGRPCSGFYCDTFLYTKPGRFGRIVGGDELAREGAIECVHAYKTPGMSISGELSSNNRVGAFILKTKDVESMGGCIEQVLGKIDVVDTEGSSMLRRDIYQYL